MGAGVSEPFFILQFNMLPTVLDKGFWSITAYGYKTEIRCFDNIGRRPAWNMCESAFLLNFSLCGATICPLQHKIEVLL